MSDFKSAIWVPAVADEEPGGRCLEVQVKNLIVAVVVVLRCWRT